MAALTDEQQRTRDHETAHLDLGLGIGQVESGLRLAAKHGLTVKWVVDGGVEVAEPAVWPRPELAEVPAAFEYRDWPVPATDRDDR